jgi:hypothetical protein
MKLIRCLKCDDVVRLVHTKWRKCECGESGGQYNDDLMSATVGGNCEVIGLRNDYFAKKPGSKKRDDDGLNVIIQGEYDGDVQIHRIKSGDGPKLKMKIEKLNGENNLITFTDDRDYEINVKGKDKSPKTIEIPINKSGPSFKPKKIKEGVDIKNMFKKHITSYIDNRIIK